MKVFLFKRLITMLITLLVASSIVFFVLEILPGDPAAVMLGINAEADTLAALRAELGLDRPVAVRYFAWLGDLVRGDLGISYTYDVPVSELIKERLILSFPLAILAITLSTLIAIPLGIIAASNHTRPLDFLVMIFSQLGIAIPNFWFALLLIIIFSVFLGVLPAGGFAGWDAGIVPALLSLLLPTIALALPQSAILTRVTRSSLLEVLKEDYIRTARAKGSSRRRTLWRHALRNAMIPVVTIMGLQFSFLLAGTIIIENVFYLPGIGRLIFQAIAQRDLIVVKNLVILLAGSVIIINFIVDMLYAVIDPRLRGEKNV
ncbi:MAG: ABC transporter permease [Deltaproteobacteria bacterium]|nr:MAG: ABC transporter permease [Deltaproteobacteria bacterium]RLC20526.1 MAG: ABC transporter permease [Deltaproteobacteria bacterium]